VKVEEPTGSEAAAVRRHRRPELAWSLAARAPPHIVPVAVEGTPSRFSATAFRLVPVARWGVTPRVRSARTGRSSDAEGSRRSPLTLILSLKGRRDRKACGCEVHFDARLFRGLGSLAYNEPKIRGKRGVGRAYWGVKEGKNGGKAGVPAARRQRKKACGGRIFLD